MHMKPQIAYMTMISVDSSNGSFLVPYDYLPNPDEFFDEDTEELAQEYKELCVQFSDIVTDSEDVYSAEVISGYFSRYSAAGYMDCTDWYGPYNSEEEAYQELLDVYGPDETYDNLLLDIEN